MTSPTRCPSFYRAPLMAKFVFLRCNLDKGHIGKHRADYCVAEGITEWTDQEEVER